MQIGRPTGRHRLSFRAEHAGTETPGSIPHIGKSLYGRSLVLETKCHKSGIREDQLLVFSAESVRLLSLPHPAQLYRVCNIPATITDHRIVGKLEYLYRLDSDGYVKCHLTLQYPRWLW